MTIEIHEPALEALIEQRMNEGRFHSVEEMVGEALRSSALHDLMEKPDTALTGADVLAAFQTSPYKDLDIEPARLYLPVRDVTL